MTFTAGSKVPASDLDLLVTNTTQMIGAAQTAATIVMTGSAIDLTGTSLTFSTQYTNTKIAIWAVFDVSVSANVTFVGTCLVDGTLQIGEAHGGGVANFRATCPGMWLTTLSAAGNHTIKLQGNAANTATTYSSHTKWHALVFGP